MKTDNWIDVYEKESPTAVEFVIDSIKKALMSKNLKPGDKLPSETALAESMQVSRSTIREAIKVLSAYGIVEVSRGNGTFVSNNDKNISTDPVLFGFLLSQPSMREQIEFRTYMEKIVMSLAISNADEGNIEKLEANYDRLKSCAGTATESAKIDLEFHELLGRSTNNKMIERIYILCILYFSTSIESTHKNKLRDGALRVHRLTIDAIKNRNFSAIDSVVEENLKTWVNNADVALFGDNTDYLKSNYLNQDLPLF